MNSFTNEDIIARINLVLPDRFDKTDETDIYGFWYGIADVLKLNSDQIDELFRENAVTSATGEYLDNIIGSLAKIGRKESEEDESYRQRYWNQTFKYNCSKNGIKQISIDIAGREPYAMYTDRLTGAFWDSEHFYNDDPFMSIYGNGDPEKFVGYLQFGRMPEDDRLNEICDLIDKVRGRGIDIYLVFPQEDNTIIDITELILGDRVILV